MGKQLEQTYLKKKKSLLTGQWAQEKVHNIINH